VCVRACVRSCACVRARMLAWMPQFLGMLAAISLSAWDPSKIHTRSEPGTRFVSPCTTLSALGVDFARYVHDVRAMRFRLAFGLAIYKDSGLAFDFFRYIQDFRFMRFRIVRLPNGMEFVECLVPFAPVFSARSRAIRLRFPDYLGQLYTMILIFTSVAFPFDALAPFSEIDTPVLDVRAIFSKSAILVETSPQILEIGLPAVAASRCFGIPLSPVQTRMSRRLRGSGLEALKSAMESEVADQRPTINHITLAQYHRQNHKLNHNSSAVP